MQRSAHLGHDQGIDRSGTVPRHHAPANYGANYQRPAAVKATCDLDNLFHLKQNIGPANGH